MSVTLGLLFAAGLVLAIVVIAWQRRSASAAAIAPPDAASGARRIAELELVVRELSASRASAEAAARRKDEFLAILSHELRSPLNAILGWTQVVEPARDLPSDVAHAFRVIHRSGLRLRQLLDDLFDISSIASGHSRGERRPVSLRDAIDEACEAIWPEALRKSVRIECRANEDALVMGDARRLQQIFWNLLANAIRFTPPEGRVEVRAARRDGHAVIIVEDTGAGIERSFLPHVFDPFSQQPGSESQDHHLGLGLALVHYLVADHGGQVSAESDGAGKGARFTVALPLATSEEVGRFGAPDTHLDRGSFAGISLHGVRVLAVDDDADWRDLVDRILTSAGAETRLAASGPHGLQLLTGWRPDVVLSDLAMPGMDGYGFLAALRTRSHELSGVPVVAMSAHAAPEDESRTLRAGFAMHLAKPISPRSLIDALVRVARRPGGGASGQEPTRRHAM